MHSPQAIVRCSADCDEFIASIKTDATVNASPAARVASFRAWGQIGPILQKYCYGALYFITTEDENDERQLATPEETVRAEPTAKGIEFKGLLYDNHRLQAVVFRRLPGWYGDLTSQEESFVAKTLKRLRLRRDPESSYSKIDQVIKIQVLP